MKDFPYKCSNTFLYFSFVDIKFFFFIKYFCYDFMQKGYAALRADYVSGHLKCNLYTCACSSL